MVRVLTGLLFTTSSCIFAFAPINEQARYFQQHMWSEFLRLEGNTAQAVKVSASNLEQHAPVYAYKSYLAALAAADDYPAIIPLIPKIDAVFPDNPNLGMITAQALEETGNKSDADARYIKLNERFKGNQEIAYHTIEAFVQRKEPENALRVIDAELNATARKPNSFIFYFLKSQILTQMGKLAAALENIKKCVELQPAFDKGWFLLAYLQEQEGKLNDAIKGYTNFLELAGDNEQIRDHLIQLIFKQKMAAQKNNVVVVGKDCFAQALQFFETEQYAKALKNIDQCMAASPDDPESQLLKIRILTAMGKHDQVLQSLKGWLIKDPNNRQWFHMLTLLPRAGVPYKSVTAALAEIEKKHPKSLHATLYLADCYLRNQDQAGALPCLARAVILTDDNTLKTRIYFQMGVIHYTKKEFTKAQQVLEQGRALHTDFPPLLNLLAYYYTTENKDLIKAQQLMNLVLHYDSKNPHFLDTQALIYFEQKNYARALKIWRSVAPQVPDDFLVQQHLGQALYMNGSKGDGINTLKKALQLALNKEDKQRCSQLLKQWELAPK